MTLTRRAIAMLGRRALPFLLPMLPLLLVGAAGCGGGDDEVPVYVLAIDGPAQLAEAAALMAVLCGAGVCRTQSWDDALDYLQQASERGWASAVLSRSSCVRAAISRAAASFMPRISSSRQRSQW